MQFEINIQVWKIFAVWASWKQWIELEMERREWWVVESLMESKWAFVNGAPIKCASAKFYHKHKLSGVQMEKAKVLAAVVVLRLTCNHVGQLSISAAGTITSVLLESYFYWSSNGARPATNHTFVLWIFTSLLIVILYIGQSNIWQVIQIVIEYWSPLYISSLVHQHYKLFSK